MRRLRMYTWVTAVRLHQKRQPRVYYVSSPVEMQFEGLSSAKIDPRIEIQEDTVYPQLKSSALLANCSIFIGVLFKLQSYIYLSFEPKIESWIIDSIFRTSFLFKIERLSIMHNMFAVFIAVLKKPSLKNLISKNISVQFLFIKKMNEK